MNDRRITEQPVLEERRQSIADRRKHLRIFCDESLDRWLAAVALRNGISGLIVADKEGGLVASSHERDEGRELAAMAGQAMTGDEIAVADFDSAKLLVLSFPWEEHRLLIGALGDEAKGRAALAEAGARIAQVLAGT